MLDVVRIDGYPVEMLDLSMALESDLGIDSIKRWRSCRRFRSGFWVADVETATMAALVTLQEIVDYLQSLITPAVHNGVSVVPVAPWLRLCTRCCGARGCAVAAPVISAAGAELVAQMLDVVADKTVIVEMLDLSMALESDLGIDSIKRVEILSAVQDGFLGCRMWKTATMAALVTLQEIVDYLQSLITPAVHNGVSVVPVAPVLRFAQRCCGARGSAGSGFGCCGCAGGVSARVRSWWRRCLMCGG